MTCAGAIPWFIKGRMRGGPPNAGVVWTIGKLDGSVAALEQSAAVIGKRLWSHQHIAIVRSSGASWRLR